MVVMLKRPKVTKPAERQIKTISLPVEFKADGDTPGAFRATFSLFNKKDLDGDVTLPGAFIPGAPVRIAQWGHNWSSPSIGRGSIGANGERAWIDGQFNLNMASGKETYESVKASGELQQWSYGYDINAARPGKFEGEDVQFLESLTVHEISPVMLGAQPLTSTDRIKGTKVGRRNSAADETAMRDALTALEAARATLRRVLGEDDDDTDDEDDGSDDGKASKGGSSKAEAKTRETTAARIALELLELDN